MKAVIGITGGISTGKSNVSNEIRNLGYKVIDSDEIYRNLSKKGMPICKKIEECFGKKYILDNGEINRLELGKLIFYDEASKNKLNSITHPEIVKEIKKQISNSSEELIFVDIPLLYEAKLEYLCDAVLCVYVDYEEQIKRLMKRDKIDYSYAKAKINSQMDINEKIKLSKYSLSSEGSFIDTKAKIIKIIDKIKGDFYGNNS